MSSHLLGVRVHVRPVPPLSPCREYGFVRHACIPHGLVLKVTVVVEVEAGPRSDDCTPDTNSAKQRLVAFWRQAHGGINYNKEIKKTHTNAGLGSFGAAFSRRLLPVRPVSCHTACEDRGAPPRTPTKQTADRPCLGRPLRRSTTTTNKSSYRYS